MNAQRTSFSRDKMYSPLRFFLPKIFIQGENKAGTVGWRIIPSQRNGIVCSDYRISFAVSSVDQRF